MKWERCTEDPPRNGRTLSAQPNRSDQAIIKQITTHQKLNVTLFLQMQEIHAQNQLIKKTITRSHILSELFHIRISFARWKHLKAILFMIKHSHVSLQILLHSERFRAAEPIDHKYIINFQLEELEIMTLRPACIPFNYYTICR